MDNITSEAKKSALKAIVVHAMIKAQNEYLTSNMPTKYEQLQQIADNVLDSENVNSLVEVLVS